MAAVSCVFCRCFFYLLGFFNFAADVCGKRSWLRPSEWALIKVSNPSTPGFNFECVPPSIFFLKKTINSKFKWKLDFTCFCFSVPLQVDFPFISTFASSRQWRCRIRTPVPQVTGHVVHSSQADQPSLKVEICISKLKMLSIEFVA